MTVYNAVEFTRIAETFNRAARGEIDLGYQEIINLFDSAEYHGNVMLSEMEKDGDEQAAIVRKTLEQLRQFKYSFILEVGCSGFVDSGEICLN